MNKKIIAKQIVSIAKEIMAFAQGKWTEVSQVTSTFSIVWGVKIISLHGINGVEILLKQFKQVEEESQQASYNVVRDIQNLGFEITPLKNLGSYVEVQDDGLYYKVTFVFTLKDKTQGERLNKLLQSWIRH